MTAKAGRKLTALELFAGAGGMALGLRRAGFHHIALLERDPNAIATLRQNARSRAGVHPELPIDPVDVCEFRYGRLPVVVDLLAAGVPCQPFSLAGNHHGTDDERNLFPEVFRAQRELAPRAILVENVWGLARPDFRPYLEYILLQLALPHVIRRASEAWVGHKHRLLRCLGSGGATRQPTYDVWVAALECANYGVPQRRNRLFVVALRTGRSARLAWPRESHSEDSLLFAKYGSGSYWREHGLRFHQVGDSVQERQFAMNGSRRWRTVRDALRGLPEPARRGTTGVSHPNHLALPGPRSYRGHTGSPIDEPAKTLKAGVHGVPGGENMLLLEDGSLRYFSVHEAALLQTFPASYVFAGSRTAAMRQIGNAAPAAVVGLVGWAIRRALEKEVSRPIKSPHVDLGSGEPLRQF
jgi:DNA (cytosine-5)-methyltransferase 1